MDQFLRELYVSRIISGGVKINKIIYKTPSQEEFYDINQQYFRLKDEALSMDLMPSAEHFLWLLDNKFWSKEEENTYNELLKELDNLKVTLYQVFYKNTEKKIIKLKIAKVKEEINKLYSKRHHKDNMSVDYHIRLNKTKLTIAMGLYRKDGKKLFRSVNHALNTSKTDIIDLSFNYVMMNKITESDYRELARNDPWKNFWSCKEAGNLFGKPIVDISDEQKQLILCSVMYDNIYKHTESPPESVLEDDDCLDGWMILQKRKRKVEENKNSLENVVTNEKIRNSQEVFIMSDGSKEEFDKINAFNDPASVRAKKERFDFLAKKGEVEEQHMPDSQRKMREMMNGNASTN